MQRVRIQQWLLLVLRTLAITFLIAAFARPTLQTGLGWMGSGNWSVAMVVDNSLSMTLRDKGGAYLDQIRSRAADIISMLEPADEVFMATPGEEFRGGRRRVTEMLEAMQASAATTAMAPELVRAGAFLSQEASHINRKVFYLGDYQRSTLLDSLPTAMPDNISVTLVPVGRAVRGNVSVTDVSVASRIVEVGQPARIEATVFNFGTEALTGYVASLYLEGERLARATLDLLPGQATTAQFTLTPQQRGWLAGMVQLEDDGLAEDNVHYFSLHVPESRRILLVRGLDAESEFVETVLSSRLNRGRLSVEYETIEGKQVAAVSLGAYDAVVLLGLGSLSSGERASLARYVDAGGGLLIFPGEEMRLEDYGALLQLLGGGRLAGYGGVLGSAVAEAAFESVDLEHPLFEGVFAEAAQTVESPSIYRMLQYVPESGMESTVIALSNGFPFLQEIRKGRGAAFIFSVAPDLRWSDLPVLGLFVPLLYRSIYYLSAGETVQGDQLLVSQPAVVRVPGSLPDARLDLVSLDGPDTTPLQRHLFGVTMLEIDDSLERPGIYDVRSREQVVRRLAVNLDPRESDLRTYAPAQAARLLGAALQVHIGVQEVLQRRGLLEAGRAGVELWKLFIMLALCSLVAEMLVAAKWRSKASVL